MRSLVLALALSLLGSLLVAETRADVPASDASLPLFAIRKTENRNRVEYALAVDASCRPRGQSPVFAYWRMLEVGPSARASLERREQRAYGISRQRAIPETDGFRIDVTLRALVARPVTVRARTVRGECTARATMTIEGTVCEIDDVLVVQRGALRVDHLELRGRAVTDGSPRTETISP